MHRVFQCLHRKLAVLEASNATHPFVTLRRSAWRLPVRAQPIEATPYNWPHDGQLAADSTALLIIDMQRDFCDPGGYICSMGYEIEPVRAIVPTIVEVRKRVRAWGGRVIYTREGHRSDLTDLPQHKAWRSRKAGAEIGSLGPLGRFLVRGEPGWEIISELQPSHGEPVIDKSGYSAFFGTDLDRILQSLGIRRLILTGTTTDICVSSTLRAAVERGYECLLVSDGCAATDRDNHNAALRTAMTEGGILGAVSLGSDVRFVTSSDHVARP